MLSRQHAVGLSNLFTDNSCLLWLFDIDKSGTEAKSIKTVGCKTTLINSMVQMGNKYSL